jgi:hypothetical protein
MRATHQDSLEGWRNRVQEAVEGRTWRTDDWHATIAYEVRALGQQEDKRGCPSICCDGGRRPAAAATAVI